MNKLTDEVLENVSGGWNVDDLSPEELAELERQGGILMEMQLSPRTGGPTYSKEEIMAQYDKISALEHKYKEKYG